MTKMLQLASLIFISYLFSLRYDNFEAFAMFSASCLLVLEFVEDFWRWIRFEVWSLWKRLKKWLS